MEDQDWQNIINELTEQLKQVCIERAVARADVNKAKSIIDAQQKKIKELEESASEEVHRITTKE